MIGNYQHLSVRGSGGNAPEVISVIVPKAVQVYLPAMASALFRLLALVALMLMPAGMAAPALAQSSTSATPASHCDEHQVPDGAPAQPQAHCTGCTALPALDAPPAIAELLPEPTRFLPRTQFVSGIILEIATPPPKQV